MDSIKIIALAIVVMLAVYAPIMLWNRRKTAQLIRETEDSLTVSGEHAVLGPMGVLFYEPILRWLGMRARHGVVTLTDDRLIIRPLVGPETDIPLADIAKVWKSKWYNASHGAGYTHVALKLEDGQRFAILVKDPRPWMERLGKQVRSNQ